MRTLQRLLTPSLADALFVALFLCLSLALGHTLLEDGDTSFHIRAGEHMLDTHSVLRHDIFSFHTPAIPWTTHEWLAELLMGAVHRAAGLGGVVALYAGLIALTLALLFGLQLLPRGNLAAALIVIVVVTAMSILHWHARPHLFTFVFLVVFSSVLERHREGAQRRLRLLPLLMVPWVNLHGGFVFGFILLGVHGLDAALLRVIQGAGASQPNGRRFKQLLVTAGACLAAALINPLGYRILLFPLNLAADKYVLDHVGEMMSPNFHEQLWFAYFIVLLALLLGTARARLSAVEAMTLGGFLFMSLYSSRHIALLALVSAPILYRLIVSAPGARVRAALEWSAARSAGALEIDRQARFHLWPIASLLLVGVLATIGRVDYRFDPRQKPVDAVRFLLEERVEGRMFNNDEFGDYLIYAAWPRYQVFFDGRGDMYGAERMREYQHVASIEPELDEVLTKYDISWVFFGSGSALSQYLLARDDWRLIYSDRVADIFVKEIELHQRLLRRYGDTAPYSEAAGSTPAQRDR